MKRTAYDTRQDIVSLEIFTVGDRVECYTVGEYGVIEIQFKAGTSGHEYNVIYSNSIAQFRGCSFKATWSTK